MNSTLVQHSKRSFTIIENEIINNKNLSWGAKGLWMYLSSKPDGWSYFKSEIKSHSNESEGKVQKYIKELEANKYLYKRQEVQEGTNKLCWKWYLIKETADIEEREKEIEKIGLRQRKNTMMLKYDHRKIASYNNTDVSSKTETASKTEELHSNAPKNTEIIKRESVSTEQPIGEQVAKPQKSSFERLTEWYCRHFVAGSEERKKQFLKDFGFFFYDLLDRCNDSVRLAGCVIKICKERYKCELEGILSNFDNVLADAMTQAFGANPVIDTKKLEKDINKPRRKKTTLQIFSNFVLSKYEANGNNFTDNQKKVWFSRNCKSMSDILKFCENDIELALECVKVCAERLEKAGFEGGLDAVARNINTYYLEAKKRLKRS